MLHQYG